MSNDEVNDRAKPAGCYWKADNSVPTGYFNTIFDTALTQVQLFDNNGGVCKKQGNHLN